MNGVELNFNAAQVAPQLGIDPAPAGWYIMAITESELKPTKQGDGAYLNLTFSIMDGAHKGKKCFMRLNVRNANQTAQEIAYKQLSAVAHAAGIMNVQNSAQLHNIPMKAKLKLRKDPSGQYDDNNEISALKNMREPVPEMDGQALGAAPTGPGFTMPPVQQPQLAPAAPQYSHPPQGMTAPIQYAPQPQQQPQYQQPIQQHPQQPAFDPSQYAAQPWTNPQAAPVQQPPAQVQQPVQQPQQPQQPPQWATANPVQPPAQQTQPQQHTAAPQGYAPSTDLPPWARPIQ